MLGAALALLFFNPGGIGAALAAADAQRGKLVYEARCSACHEVSVHNRKARKAKSYDALRVQVLRWSGEVGGSWSKDDVDDVTLYLNQAFYRFKCPPGVCRANQASLARQPCFSHG